MRNIHHKSPHRLSVRRLLAGLAVGISLLAGPSAPTLSRIIDGVAIIVNRDAVLVSEVNAAMAPMMQEYQARYAGAELKRKMAELREMIIKQAIETKLILQVAKVNGIRVDDGLVDSRIEVLKKRFPSEEEFLRTLSLKDTTLKQFREQVAEQVLVQETKRRVLGEDIHAPADEMEQYYNEHPDEFEVKPRVSLAQIFLGIPKDASQEKIEEARRRAEQLGLMLEEGADFSELAGKYSEGPYREKGGLVGIVGPGEILPDLEDVVFSLKKGEVSPVVRTKYGFHILRALDVTRARKIGFEEARPFIEERLREMKRSEKYDDWIEALKDDSYIDIRI